MNKYWNLKIRSAGATNNVSFLVSELSRKGDAMLEELLERKDYENQTYNLVSGYAYVIFYGGKIMAMNRTPNISRRKHKYYGTYVDANDEIAKEIGRLRGLVDEDKVTFIIFSAMFYSKFVEDPNRYSRRFAVFKTILSDEVNSLAIKYKGKVSSYG